MSVQPGYVLVERPPGYEVDLNEQPALFEELLAVCKEADCQKVLIRGRNTKVGLGVLDIYDLGEEIAKLQLQIAMVESHDASDQDVGFLENVASNRGGPIRFFADEEDARQWLGV